MPGIHTSCSYSRVAVRFPNDYIYRIHTEGIVWLSVFVCHLTIYGIKIVYNMLERWLSVQEN